MPVIEPVSWPNGCRAQHQDSNTIHNSTREDFIVMLLPDRALSALRWFDRPCLFSEPCGSSAHSYARRARVA